MSRPKKKILLFLVEGYTDINVLSSPIISFVENNSLSDQEFIVEFCSYRDENASGGDVTSRNGVNPDNIESVISKNVIKPFFSRNQHYYLKDVYKVIMITDLDGAYISDENIIKCEEPEEKLIYNSTSIITNNPSSTIERNERKRLNIDKLVELDEIKLSQNGGKNSKNIPFSIYYFSSNLEDCLYGIKNVTSAEKVKLSDNFMRQIDTFEAFYNYLSERKVFSEKTDYKDSWEEIRDYGEKSLMPGTNIHIMFDRLNRELF